MKLRQLVFCSVCVALATITSFIKISTLPFGGSITLFSMFFICLTGYLFGIKSGILSGVAYGILSFLLNPYVFAPLQVLLDYPLAFGALGLSGIFSRTRGKKSFVPNSYHYLILGYTLGVTGRYLCHVLSGYVFFSTYAPDTINPFLYTIGYNLTYLLPEMILTIILLYLPAVRKIILYITKLL